MDHDLFTEGQQELERENARLSALYDDDEDIPEPIFRPVSTADDEKEKALAEEIAQLKRRINEHKRKRDMALRLVHDPHTFIKHFRDDLQHGEQLVMPTRLSAEETAAKRQRVQIFNGNWVNEASILLVRDEARETQRLKDAAHPASELQDGVIGADSTQSLMHSLSYPPGLVLVCLFLFWVPAARARERPGMCELSLNICGSHSERRGE